MFQIYKMYTFIALWEPVWLNGHFMFSGHNILRLQHVQCVSEALNANMAFRMVAGCAFVNFVQSFTCHVDSDILHYLLDLK